MWKNFQITYTADSSVATTSTTTVSSTTTTITTTTTQQTSFQCYDCSGPDCGKEGSTISTNCTTCMAYRNPDDQSKTLEKFEKYSSIDRYQQQKSYDVAVGGDVEYRIRLVFITDWKNIFVLLINAMDMV